ncbi:hypothetical protein WMY93_004222 [Mugilogobius chulae]|uniref:HAT C-terminal dimerisation domain-containing protein n=1 Tax=Mugilogobius chulae TaxID=88201 RepID=A0AAW0PYM4_9GOBI
MEMSFPVVRQKKKKRQFDYEGREETGGNPEDLFRRDFFLQLVDTAIVTIRTRFSHLQEFFDLYGFLYSVEMLRTTAQEGKLQKCCQNLEHKMNDIEAHDLQMEIHGALKTFPPHLLSPFDMLNHIYKQNILDLYPNLSIALRLLLTLPVTVASGERSFSSLKRLKTYLRSTMSQERLSALALISIEHEIRRSLNMDFIIDRFKKRPPTPPFCNSSSKL